MHKATKIFLIVAAVVFALFAGWYGFNYYGYEHPKIAINFVTSDEGAENVFTVPQIDFKERSSWGVAEYWDNRYYEAYDIINKMIALAHTHDDHKPYLFDSRVEIIYGKTVFTFEGYYTENGERQTVAETYTLDYVLTENIKKH